MKTTPVTAADLSASVLAVPPLARYADLTLNEEANRQLIGYLEAGGVRSLMYGGNANFYNISVGEYAEVLDFLVDAAGPDTWLIPSFGPDYGKLIDQAKILRGSRVPTAMALPQTFPATPEGVEVGLRRAAVTMGKPLILYIKAENYIAPEAAGRLMREGLVCAVKYGVVRADPAQDEYLGRLLDHVDPKLVISGIGERPAITHFRQFGLSSFTSGSVCVAPRGSMAMLAALGCGNWAAAEQLREAYIPLEDLRDGISPIRTLHDAVTLAGIADMGPMLPLMSVLGPEQRAKVKPVALALRDWDAGQAKAQAAE
ncbi:dihydrodipicolinate synthase family protein [Ferrovibrio sp.]|uniref:dihydrodipicolinate synthase family protein n=1 Tax=Ferrovibrio sp. TaxID=1917215 RepID=UPI00262A596D|nr:dihydrodipicolinate synthase family protein [Ferrovibrio sp.]